MRNRRMARFKACLVALGMILAISATLGALGTISDSQVSSDPAKSGRFFNPLQVALLHWYPANLTTTFTVGSNPTGIAFDGAHIWVTNFGDNTVSEMQANDGTLLGTFSVGTNPYGLAFDG